MRLTQSEIASIKSILANFDSSGEVYLFGSRLDDEKKGGDIDLLFVVKEKPSLKSLLRVENLLESALDCKTDLLLYVKGSPISPIQSIALKGVRL